MSGSHPQVVPRKSTSVRARIGSGDRPSENVNGASGESNPKSQQNVDREVEMLNHCFEDVEKFMTRLQQAAEARIVLNQRKKKSGRKEKTQDVADLLTTKAGPPPEEDFIKVFQKIKYSISLMDRLKPVISNPNAPELLHHIFVPLNLLVQTTGGPTLAASVVSPAMTSGAVSLLHEHLNKEEKELWISLGTNWTSPCLGLGKAVPLYSPVFLDGWKPQAFDSTGRQLEDPVQLQHKEDVVKDKERRQKQNQPPPTADGSDKIDGIWLPQNNDNLYRCSYAFVARNSSELSVLNGETLEVLDSSKRWWKCRNNYDQIGFVPYNILEPLSAVNNAERNNPVLRPDSKQTPSNPRTKCYSYTPSSSGGADSPGLTRVVRPQSMVLPSSPMSKEDEDRFQVMNDELMQRLAKQRNSVDQPPVDTSVSLNYKSPPAEVKTWLTANSFNQQTIDCLGILTGAQLFSLSEEELCSVIQEGPKVYSQVQDQKSHLEDVRKAAEIAMKTK